MWFDKFDAVILYAVAAGMLSVSSALANDARAPSHDWSGFYLGVALGGAQSAAEPDTKAVHNGYFVANGVGSDRAQVNPTLQENINGQNVTGSVLAGYDFQSDSITYGLEADLTFMAFSQTESFGPVAYLTVPAAAFTTQTRVESDFQLSFRPKLGYVTGPLQFHVAAGPSISRFKTVHKFSDTFGGGNNLTFSDTKTALGISSSVGMGYMMSDGWALRSDYVFSYYPRIVGGASEFDGDGRVDFLYDSSFKSHNLRLALIKGF
ncbi:outer membrane beta-barrel protein [Parvibaculaceae bacterium PLY_AMNH_Bact1]|nr:outer membrane beta-barrel protein [Parvibaculaceae bacterium PLY_AMNH_Bact1]